MSVFAIVFKAGVSRVSKLISYSFHSLHKNGSRIVNFPFYGLTVVVYIYCSPSWLRNSVQNNLKCEVKR